EVARRVLAVVAEELAVRVGQRGGREQATALEREAHMVGITCRGARGAGAECQREEARQQGQAVKPGAANGEHGTSSPRCGAEGEAPASPLRTYARIARPGRAGL